MQSLYKQGGSANYSTKYLLIVASNDHIIPLSLKTERYLQALIKQSGVLRP